MRKFAVAAAAALLAPVMAKAEDAPSSAVSAIGIPSGVYVGGHVGYGFGSATATLGDPIGVATAGGPSGYGLPFGGLPGGYPQTPPARRVWGGEPRFSLPQLIDTEDTL